MGTRGPRARRCDPPRRGVRRRRCVHLRPVGQAWRLVGLLPDAEGAAVATRLAALAGRLAEEERAAEAEAGLERVPLAARMADALVTLVTKDVGDEATAERAMVVVHVDATLLAGGSGLAELEAGPALAAETAARLACDASVQVSIDNAAGEAIGLGRRSRSVPPWLSRQLRLRDGHCRFPGCARRRFAQAHHLRHWGKGGPTDRDKSTASWVVLTGGVIVARYWQCVDRPIRARSRAEDHGQRRTGCLHAAPASAGARASLWKGP